MIFSKRVVWFLLLLLPTITFAAQEAGTFRELQFVREIPAETEEDVYFKFPAIIDMDKDGNIYAFDHNTHHFVYKISPQGKLLKTIGRRGRGPADLYVPRLIRVWDDKLVVLDRFGISVFRQDGTFLSRFKTFYPVNSFDVYENKIYMVLGGTKELFTVYSLEGKKITAFGKKYKGNRAVFPRTSPVDLDKDINEGNVLCAPDRVIFVSQYFGDIHQYDYSGTFIGKHTMKNLAKNSAFIIKRNKKIFYETGPGSGLFKIAFYSDVQYLDGRLYFLSLEKSEYDTIRAVDLDTFEIMKRYRFYWPNGSKGEDFACTQFAIRKEKNTLRFLVSLIETEERDLCLGIYK